MKKIALAGLAGMLLVSASVNAMSISGQAGKEYTNIGVGFGTESTGLALSGNGHITTTTVTSLAWGWG